MKNKLYDSHTTDHHNGKDKLMDMLPIEMEAIASIVSHFPVELKAVTDFCNTSRSETDIRWNFIFGQVYVLKINSENSMWEERLQEISRLIARYNAIGVYCPCLIPSSAHKISYTWYHDGKTYTCFIEEFAKYPVCAFEAEFHDPEIIAHLGRLAARYTDVDLCETRSMWSIIDLAPLDTTVDEKQENSDMLVGALKEHGYTELAYRVAEYNTALRASILPHFRALPRCVFQGDLNNTNLLQHNGRFAGLIDFNCSGTDVNINVFLNETNCFPNETKFDTLTIPELLSVMEREHREEMAVILMHYTLNDLEKQMYPYFRQLVELFQYPDVCSMVKWLSEDSRREKCANLIMALMAQPILPEV